MSTINCIQPLSGSYWVLKKFGLWPVNRLTTQIVIKLILHLILDIFLISMMIHNMNNAIRSKDIVLFNWMTCLLLPIVTWYTKIITLLKNKNVFFSILDDLRSNTFNIHSEKLNEHVRRINKIMKTLAKYFGAVVVLCILIFSVMPFVTPLTIAIPASFNLGKYDVLYKVGHLLFTSYIGTSSIAYDILYMSLMALCIAQLNILQDRLTNIFVEAKENYRNELLKSAESLEDLLRECVILHETINRFVKKLDDLLSLPLFVQYLVGCFIICNTILQLTILGEGNSTNVIGLCCYASVVFTQATAYHWLGNEITFKSNKIIEACYLSEWHELSLKSQKCIILLMERAKRPLTVTIYKLIFVSLTSLGVIVRWSYSLFAIIKARYN